MKLIGKGTFSKVYLDADLKAVTIKSSDKAKECLALWGYGDSYLWPVVERIDFEVYKMDYLPPVKSLKNNLEPRQWALYKALRELKPVINCRPWQYADHWQKAFNSLSNEFQEEKSALCEAVESLCNYGGDVQFEISPRNVRVVDGKLLLLDCFFFIHQLKDVYKK